MTVPVEAPVGEQIRPQRAVENVRIYATDRVSPLALSAGPCATAAVDLVASSSGWPPSSSIADERTSVPVTRQKAGGLSGLGHLQRLNLADGRSSHIGWQPEGHRR